MTGEDPPRSKGFWHSTVGHIVAGTAFLASIATIAALVLQVTGDDKGGSSRVESTVSSEPGTSPTPEATSPPGREPPKVTVAAWVRDMNRICGRAKTNAAARGPS